jgi:hypothetical protein
MKIENGNWSFFEINNLQCLHFILLMMIIFSSNLFASALYFIFIKDHENVLNYKN